MEVKNYFAQDASGNILPSATCYVYLAGTTDFAPGVTNINGAALPNPFTAQPSGLVQFAAPDGDYDLRVTKSGRDFTIRIQCFDGVAFAGEVMPTIQRVNDLYDAVSANLGAGVVPASHDQLYPPATLGFRFAKTFHSSDAPFNCKGDNVTDDSAGLVQLFAASRAFGGRCEVVIDPGIHLCNQLMQPTSNTTVRFVGSLKCTGNPASGTDAIIMPVNGASNVTYINPKIDLNFIPAVNGVICRTGNAGFVSIGGEVKNGRHEKGGTEGGRALLIESIFTQLNNRAPKVSDLRIVNCYMGVGIQGGSGTDTTPVNGGRSLVIIDNISIEDCDVGIVGFGVPSIGSTFPYPYAADIMHVLISNPVFRNTGKNTQYAGQDLLFGADRGCNMEVHNFSGYNTSDYPQISSIIRGNFAKCKISGTFYGNADSAVCFSPYKESDGGPQSERTVEDTDINIDVHGTLADFVRNTTTTSGYVSRTRISGSATAITSGRVVPPNFASMSTMHFDLCDRTQNSRVIGTADLASTVLFSTIPNKKIDLELARCGALDVRGDLKVSSFVPRQFMVDLSAGAKDMRQQWDGGQYLLSTESTAGTDVFDRPFIEYNDSTSVGIFYAGGFERIRYNAGGVAITGLTSVSQMLATGPIRPGQYTIATLPSAALYPGYEIDVTDAAGGSKRCRSNSSVWQILNTTTTVT